MLEVLLLIVSGQEVRQNVSSHKYDIVLVVVVEIYNSSDVLH